MNPNIRQLFGRFPTRYTSSPFYPDLLGFSQWLTSNGYCLRHRRRLVHLAKDALAHVRQSPTHVWTRAELTRAFLRNEPKNRAGNCARHSFQGYLASEQRFEVPVMRQPPGAQAMGAYLHHLEEMRGLAFGTIGRYLWEISIFLRATLRGGEDVDALSIRRIERYIETRASRVTRRSMSRVVSCLRLFLRFCFDQRFVVARLDQIELPIIYRNEVPPRALAWPLVRRFVGSVDKTSRTGRRDTLILHLMSHYGLRPKEVALLTLDSIDWVARTMFVDQTKTHSSLILPLDQRTVDLLDCYVRRHRPPHVTRALFLGDHAPSAPMSMTSVVDGKRGSSDQGK